MTTEEERAAEAAQVAAQAKAAAEEAARKAEELAQAAAKAAEEAAGAAAEAAEGVPAETEPPPPRGDLSELAQQVVDGYAFEGTALQIGALVENDEAVAAAQVRIPFGMLNRHGLVAGATGTGKTKTLQTLAEQVSAGGVPVFAADIKGDLSGMATPGTPSDKLAKRCESIGQDWQATASPTEFYTLGAMGTGVPIRASVESFGPTMLSKVLELNETQESSLELVFHYAKSEKLPLVTLEDLRSVLNHLSSDEGKTELKDLGGLSKATVGVILRELIGFADAGADAFFGLPEIKVTDFLRTAADGKGIVSMLEVPGVQDRPELFSTFLMYLLRQLFEVLPEVGDADKPKLVFFFDEAHLLFKDASKDFLEIVTQTVRLIRSKGVGIFFVTQTPKDVPEDVLAQLGSRVQHQLRAHTPNDAKALKATVSTFPRSSYDLEEVLTQLGIGEAIVTVMNEKGAPTPVAWTKVRAPQSSMDPTPAADIAAAVNASPLMATYGTLAEAEGAAAILAKLQAEAEAQEAKESAAAEKDKPKSSSKKTSSSKTSSSRRMSTTDRLLGEVTRTATRELMKQLFKKR